MRKIPVPDGYSLSKLMTERGTILCEIAFEYSKDDRALSLSLTRVPSWIKVNTDIPQAPRKHRFLVAPLNNVSMGESY